MKIIDFHAHVYPEKIALRATRNVSKYYGLESSEIAATPAELIREGAEVGINEFLLLPVAMKPGQAREVNDFAISLLKDPHFHSFGSVHAAMGEDALIEEADYIRANGLLGIKIHPETQCFAIDDERLFPLYDYCQEKEIPFYFHCGQYTNNYSHPERLRYILKLFPRLDVVGAHLGGWNVFEEGPEFLKDLNCYTDISSCMEFVDKDDMVRYIRMFGAERCMFGCDFPFFLPKEVKELFMQLPLTDRERELIAHENAEMLLEKWSKKAGK